MQCIFSSLSAPCAFSPPRAFSAPRALSSPRGVDIDNKGQARHICGAKSLNQLKMRHWMTDLWEKSYPEKLQRLYFSGFTQLFLLIRKAALRDRLQKSGSCPVMWRQLNRMHSYAPQMWRFLSVFTVFAPQTSARHLKNPAIAKDPAVWQGLPMENV